MKKAFITFITILGIYSAEAQAEKLCKVVVCNKLERFTLDPWSMIKDSMGETCFEGTLSSLEAVPGKVLSSESRWYQGSSINPTKKSVTRVKEILNCWEVK